jgi:coatomer subunit beta'
MLNRDYVKMEKRFQKEFDNLKRLKHENVVELVGFCNESERVVAEYNGKQVIAEEVHIGALL